MVSHLKSNFISTSHGNVSYLDSEGGELAVLMLHGNSARKEMFDGQFEGLGNRWRLIAIDLPGHGESSPASDPARTYSLSGFADCAAEVLAALSVSKVVVVGVSLGGHIALQMTETFPGIQGIAISGAPPFRKTTEGLAEAFGSDPRAALSFKRDLSSQDVRDFATALTDGAEPVQFWEEAVSRADPECRACLGAAFLDEAAQDQRVVAERFERPLAVLNGADDTFVNHQYFETIPFKSLWSGRVHRLPGQRHAPQLLAPQMFNELLGRFLEDVL
jgi:pimeloyl-ACP methyl ester carboxylesterase